MAAGRRVDAVTMPKPRELSTEFMAVSALLPAA
jgi:hypothetical protein